MYLYHSKYKGYDEKDLFHTVKKLSRCIGAFLVNVNQCCCDCTVIYKIAIVLYKSIIGTLQKKYI